jgi:hypothetical protein
MAVRMRPGRYVGRLEIAAISAGRGAPIFEVLVALSGEPRWDGVFPAGGAGDGGVVTMSEIVAQRSYSATTHLSQLAVGVGVTAASTSTSAQAAATRASAWFPQRAPTGIGGRIVVGADVDVD